MKKYEFIKNDEEIIKIYNEISKLEEADKEKGGAHHNLQHAINVANLVEKLLTDLNYDEKFIDEAKVSAILHDVGCINGKEAHPERSYEFAKEYLERKNIQLENKEKVLEAIKNHSSGFDTENIITLTLILSDKLDVKFTRITENGKNLLGNRQFLHIKDVNVQIKNNSLIVEFISDGNLNLEELEDYYFINKIFNSIKAFSNKMELIPEVFLDNKKWNKFYME